MKNIHLLPTDKPSRLSINTCFDNVLELWDKIDVPEIKQDGCIQDYNIYITSDEEIKVNDYITDVYLVWKWKDDSSLLGRKKVILTTDPDLIKDGVQAIDDEFLEWFVKNPSCEEVKIESWQTKGEWDLDYKIIIPSEEPTMITDWLDEYGNPEIYKKVERELELRQAAEKYADFSNDYVPLAFGSKFNETTKRDFIRGAKWQQEDMIEKLEMHILTNEDDWNRNPQSQFRNFIQQFKKIKI